MNPKWIYALLFAAGTICLLWVVMLITKPDPIAEVARPTKSLSRQASPAANSMTSAGSLPSSHPGKSSSHSPSPANSSMQPPLTRADLENMEPWADKPTPHMKALGEPAKARATVNDKSFDLAPNQLGVFQRVYVGARSQIAVKVDYPKAVNGDPVIIQVQDGGQLDNGTVVQKGEIKDGNVAFNFRATENAGIHRVSLRKGSDVKTLDFWVGPPLPVRTN